MVLPIGFVFTGLSSTSVLPVLIRQRSLVQLLTVMPPSGHKAVHERAKAVVVLPLQQVNKFVDDDVLQAIPT